MSVGLPGQALLGEETRSICHQSLANQACGHLTCRRAGGLRSRQLIANRAECQSPDVTSFTSPDLTRQGRITLAPC